MPRHSLVMNTLAQEQESAFTQRDPAQLSCVLLNGLFYRTNPGKPQVQDRRGSRPSWSIAGGTELAQVLVGFTTTFIIMFFQNSVCTNCGHRLAYLPGRSALVALEPGMEDTWREVSVGKPGPACRLCLNNSRENVCNWAVGLHDPNPFCLSCRLNRVIRI